MTQRSSICQLTLTLRRIHTVESSGMSGMMDLRKAHISFFLVELRSAENG